LGIFLIKELVKKEHTHTHTHIFLAILKKKANCLNLAREKSAEPRLFDLAAFVIITKFCQKVKLKILK